MLAKLGKVPLLALARHLHVGAGIALEHFFKFFEFIDTPTETIRSWKKGKSVQENIKSASLSLIINRYLLFLFFVE